MNNEEGDGKPPTIKELRVMHSEAMGEGENWTWLEAFLVTGALLALAYLAMWAL